MKIYSILAVTLCGAVGVFAFAQITPAQTETMQTIQVFPRMRAPQPTAPLETGPSVNSTVSVGDASNLRAMEPIDMLAARVAKLEKQLANLKTENAETLATFSKFVDQKYRTHTHKFGDNTVTYHSVQIDGVYASRIDTAPALDGVTEWPTAN